MVRLVKITSMALCLLALVSCQSAYYSAMDKVGVHKRDILSDRIEGAKDAQVDAKEQFRDALDRFSQELGFHGGDLQQVYENLNDVYNDCEAEANTVSERINGIEDVAGALFDEWENELEQYTSPRLRADAASKLKQTKAQYKKMLRSMRAAEAKMEPVLATFKDQVLYLKHNLNARAISSLKTEFSSLRRDINSLIVRMDESIRESEKFIANLK